MISRLPRTTPYNLDSWSMSCRNNDYRTVNHIKLSNNSLKLFSAIYDIYDIFSCVGGSTKKVAVANSTPYLILILSGFICLCYLSTCS